MTQIEESLSRIRKELLNISSSFDIVYAELDFIHRELSQKNTVSTVTQPIEV